MNYFERVAYQMYLAGIDATAWGNGVAVNKSETERIEFGQGSHGSYYVSRAVAGMSVRAAREKTKWFTEKEDAFNAFTAMVGGNI